MHLAHLRLSDNVQLFCENAVELWSRYMINGPNRETIGKSTVGKTLTTVKAGKYPGNIITNDADTMAETITRI